MKISRLVSTAVMLGTSLLGFGSGRDGGLVSPLAFGQEIQISKDNKTIAITTSADASTLADVAVVTIGFQSFGKTSDLTYGDAARTSNAIVAALTAADIAKEAIESAEQNLYPLTPNNDEQKTHYGEGSRFQFSQSWRVTVPAEKAALVLQVAIPAGANQSGGIQWHLKDEDALQAEAARKALEHARQIAATMAQGLGAKLGSLLYASNQAPSSVPFANLRAGAGGGIAGGLPSAFARKAQPLAIRPERISASATVYAAFAIE